MYVAFAVCYWFVRHALVIVCVLMCLICGVVVCVCCWGVVLLRVLFDV